MPHVAFIHSTIIWYLFFNCNTILYVVAYVSCAFRVSVHHKHDQRQHHLSVPGEFVSAHPRVGGGAGQNIPKVPAAQWVARNRFI